MKPWLKVKSFFSGLRFLFAMPKTAAGVTQPAIQSPRVEVKIAAEGYDEAAIIDVDLYSLVVMFMEAREFKAPYVLKGQYKLFLGGREVTKPEVMKDES